VAQNDSEKKPSPGDNEEKVDEDEILVYERPLDGSEGVDVEQKLFDWQVQIPGADATSAEVQPSKITAVSSENTVTSSGPLTSQTVLPPSSEGGLPSQTPKTTYVPFAAHDSHSPDEAPLPPIWPALTPPDSSLWSGAHPNNWLSSLHPAVPDGQGKTQSSTSPSAPPLPHDPARPAQVASAAPAVPVVPKSTDATSSLPPSVLPLNPVQWAPALAGGLPVKIEPAPASAPAPPAAPAAPVAPGPQEPKQNAISAAAPERFQPPIEDVVLPKLPAQFQPPIQDVVLPPPLGQFQQPIENIVLPALPQPRSQPLDLDSRPTEFVAAADVEDLARQRNLPHPQFANILEKAPGSRSKSIFDAPKRNLVVSILVLLVVASVMAAHHFGLIFSADHADGQRLSNLLHLESGELKAANLLFSEAHYQEAIKEYNQVLEKEPKSVEAFQGRGKSNLALHSYRQAADDFTYALSFNPRLIPAKLDRGAALFYLRDFEKAREDYDQIIAIEPNNAFAYFNRGLCESKTRDFSHAVKDLDKAIELRPNYSDAYDELAAVFCAQGSPKRAIATFTLSLQVNPKSAKTFFNRGNVYHQDHDNASAIADYSMAIQLSATHPEYFNNRGYAYLETDQFEKAAIDFSSALSLDPNYELAKNNLKAANQYLKRAKPAN
jgi:tetratricopeptide (TPR) repeat protein